MQRCQFWTTSFYQSRMGDPRSANAVRPSVRSQTELYNQAIKKRYVLAQSETKISTMCKWTPTKDPRCQMCIQKGTKLKPKVYQVHQKIDPSCTKVFTQGGGSTTHPLLKQKYGLIHHIFEHFWTPYNIFGHINGKTQIVFIHDRCLAVICNEPMCYVTRSWYIVIISGDLVTRIHLPYVYLWYTHRYEYV